MNAIRLFSIACLVLMFIQLAWTADAPARKDPKEALQLFQDLIGEWPALGFPTQGTRPEQDKNGWGETVRWEWQFRKDDLWLQVNIDKGKHFTEGKLRYLPERSLYQLTAQTVGKETVTFEGPEKDLRLTLDRQDTARNETQRVVFDVINKNRFLYSYEVKAENRTTFQRQFQVGGTREGFVTTTGEIVPECVVSGGPALTKVMHKGQTYYVCCSGCRQAFYEEPEKYIKEYEEKMAKLKAAKEAKDKKK